MTLFHRQLLLILFSLAPSYGFLLSPRRIDGCFVAKRVVGSTTTRRFASEENEESSSSNNKEDDEDEDEPMLVDKEELSQFEKDLLDAFGKEKDANDDDAVTNAAFSAFARDLMNVDEIDDWKEWSDDVTDDDFLISADEAFDLYTETMDDLKDESNKVDLNNSSANDVPESEKQLVEDMVKSANKAIENIWGEKGMTNPVKDYFKQVKKQENDDNDDESSDKS